MVVNTPERDHVVRVYQNRPEIIEFYDNFYVPNRINATNHRFISFPRRTPSLVLNPPPYAGLEFYLEQDFRYYRQHPNILNNIEYLVNVLTNDNEVYRYFFDNALGVYLNPYDILTDPIADEIEVIRRYLDRAIRHRNIEIRRGTNN